MYVEASVSVDYLLSHLYTKLPRRRVDNFGEELVRCLLLKLQPHWFSESPGQDAFHRCFHTSGPYTDFIFPEAAISSGLEWSEIQACLPIDLIITIDPGHVACQYGTADSPQIISNSAWSSGNGCNSRNLSSSGCSSASSVSSSNSSSGSWSKTKHRILYSANLRDGDGGGDSYAINGEKESADFSSEVLKRQLEEVQTHLATEAALSVLTEPEEVNLPLSTPEPLNFRNSSECIAGAGDSCECHKKSSNSTCGGKTNGDQIVNSESQAESDIGNQLTLNEVIPKPLRQMEEGVGEPQQFDFHSQASFTQSSAAIPTPSFTAATFAATKFGSTKLKNQTKKNQNRLVTPCDPPPTSSYASPFMEAIGHTPVQSNQMLLCDRLNSYNSDRNFENDTIRNNFYENYQLINRSDDSALNNANGFFDGVLAMGLYGNSEAPFKMRSNNLVNNPMWSQFEKIRSEFQLKNSQYLQQQLGNSPILNCNAAFDSIPSKYNTANNTTTPENAFQHFDGKCSFADDLGLSRDPWNSQKFTSNNDNNFCWWKEVNNSSIDASVGQAISTLNITER